MKKTSKIVIVVMSAFTALLAISLITSERASTQFVASTLVTNDAEVDDTDVFTTYHQEQILDDGELFSIGLIYTINSGKKASFCIGDSNDKIRATSMNSNAEVVTGIAGFTACLSGWVDYDPVDFTNLVLTRDGVAVEERFVYTRSVDPFNKWFNRKTTDINFTFKRDIAEPGVYRLTGKYQGIDFGSDFVIVEDFITDDHAEPKALKGITGHSDFRNVGSHAFFILEFSGIQQTLYLSDITDLKVTLNGSEVAFELCGNVARHTSKNINDYQLSTQYSICFTKPFTENGVYNITGKYMGVDFEKNIMLYDEAENNTDSINRPFLGIQGRDIDEQLMDTHSLPSLGVYVEHVEENSGAKSAGIERLDIIVGFDGTEITTMEQLSDAIGDYNVGDRVIIKLFRNKLPMHLEVVLGSFEQ